MSRVILWSFLLACFLGLSVPSNLLAEDTVCIQCHGGQEGRLGAPVAAWRSSIHAENGVSCHDCHGGDPTDYAMAMSPDRGFVGAPDYADVPSFCGRCHVGIAEQYRGGAHGKALNKGAAQCVVCHGNHAIQEASIELINENSCSQCHTYERAALIRLSLVETDAQIEQVSQELDRLYRLGFNVEAMQGGLFNQRNVFHRTFHGVDVERVREETGKIQAEMSKMLGEIEAIDTTLGQRKLWGSIVICLFVVAGVIFLLVRKAYEEEEKG